MPEPPSKQLRITQSVSFRPETLQRLRELAHQEDKPVSLLVREAVRYWLDHRAAQTSR